MDVHRPPFCTRRSSFNVVLHITTSLLIFASLLHFVTAQGSVPRFRILPESSGYKEVGQRMILNCEGIGSPSPTYRWIKDGSYISSTQQTLQITAKRSDAGLYHCVITNIHGSLMSPPVSVKIAYMDTLPTQPPQTQSVQPGSSLTISLPALNSNPDPKVTWKRGTQGQPATQSITADDLNYVTRDNHDLIILDANTAMDGHTYMAQIINAQLGEITTSPQYTLNVIGASPASRIAPSIVVPLKNIAVVKASTSVKFDCIVNARPIANLTFTWYRHHNGQRGNPITKDQTKYHIEGNGRTLYLIQIQESDAGVYECEAKLFNFTPVTSSATLTLYSAPKITSNQPATVDKDYGSTETLPCEASGKPQPNITWFFNAQSVASLNNNNYKVLPNGHLEITTLSMTDSGIFQCFATNNVGVDTASTWISVLSVAPVIEVKPQNLSLIDGEDAQLTCKARGAPTPVVTWTRVVKGGDPEPVLSQGHFVVNPDKLLITVTSPEHSGRYTCTATNSQGSTSADAYLRVSIKTQIIKPPLNDTITLGDPTELSCEVSHDNSIKIYRSWSRVTAATQTRQTLPLPSTSRIDVKPNGNLVITSVFAADKGTYTCSVVSEGGNDTKSAYLKIVETPQIPVIISVVENPNRKRSVIITWSKVHDGYSPITTFRIQYRIMHNNRMTPEEGWLNLAENIAPDKRAHTIDNLTPSRNYTFRMTATNGVGESGASKPMPKPYITIPEEAPGGPPRSFYGSSPTHDSIKLNWQPPEDSLWNGYLTGYMIRYWSAGYTTITKRHKKVSGSTTTTFTLKDLISFHLYQIEIAAINTAGVGVYTSSFTVKTREGFPSGVPRNLNAYPVSSTEIRVTWIRIDPTLINGDLKNYTVTVVNVVTSAVIKVNVKPNLLSDLQSVTINKLEKYTGYKVSVVGVNGRGSGPSTADVPVATMEDVPGKVSNFKVITVQDTLIHIAWSAPKEVNGILTGYSLHYEKLNYTNTRQYFNDIPASVTTYNISGLQAETWYTITIIAKTAKGSGPAYYTNIKSGVPPELPGPPTHLGVFDIGHDSVNIQFHQGYNGKTLITLWIVQADADLRGIWKDVYETSDPQATKLTVDNLHPYTRYRLRVIAENIRGRSDPSDPTRAFQTSQTSPGSSPGSVTVRAVNATAVRVSWTPLASKDWNGVPKGYWISYRMQGSHAFKNVQIAEFNSDSYILDGLEEWIVYEVKMNAFNEVGDSGYGAVTTERTRESVPSSGPINVTAVAINSTAVIAHWSAVPHLHQNGLILGYKVKYTCTCGDGRKSVVDDIKSGLQYNHTIGRLHKYTEYSISVLAYTIMGDGVYSVPVVTVRTAEGVPGPPVIVYFPEVTYTRAKIVWEPPVQPNGVITAYRIRYYRKNESENTAFTTELAHTFREYDVRTLVKLTYYYFTVEAKTRLGWGGTAKVLVYTNHNRKIPESPKQPIFGKTCCTSREITIRWTPRKDNYGPLRNFTIEYRYRNGQWMLVTDVITPETRSHTIQNLRPNTWYQFKVAATNDIGISIFSKPSDEVRTLEDKPEGPPRNLEVKPLTTTSVRATWNPPDMVLWNSNSISYTIGYRMDRTDQSWSTLQVLHKSRLDHIISPLKILQSYEFVVWAYNSEGIGPTSRRYHLNFAIAPSAAPQDFTSEVLSSRIIRLSWKPPPVESLNGDLSGYMVHYWKRSEGMGTAKKHISVENDTMVKELDIFTYYDFTVRAYNLAGEGPWTVIIHNRTDEEVPGQPGLIRFTDITFSSLRINWDPPSQPNGIIIKYYLETSKIGHGGMESNTTEVVYQRQLPYHIQNLGLNLTYRFTVWASTKKGAGQTRSADVKIGPQKDSPFALSVPIITLGEDNTVTLLWRYCRKIESPFAPSKPIITLGEDDNTVTLRWRCCRKIGELDALYSTQSITGYAIETRTVNGTGSVLDRKWHEVLKLNDSVPEASVSLHQNGLYRFRVFSINNFGMSWPSPMSDVFHYSITAGTSLPSKVEGEFYKEWWFLVIMALTGAVIILIVISLLCLISRRNRSKRTKKSMAVVVDPRTNHMEPDNGGFSTLEMTTQSRRGPSIRNGGASRGGTLPRAPPRPTLTNIVYSDSDTAKGPIPDDSSTVSEKPSDLGDSTEPSDDESEFSEKEPPPVYFTNQFVPGPVRKSWHQHHPSHHPNTAHHSNEPPRNTHHNRHNPSSSHHGHQSRDSRPHHPPPPPTTHPHPPAYHSHPPQHPPQHPPSMNPYSYNSDSDMASSHYAATSNGSVVNNVPGSRAPMAGYSSFV